jgi:asparagine synthetase B (glutamine-hydrolysing)
MCSFLYSTKHNDENKEDLNFFLKFRGPDKTNISIINNDLYIHNLLSITGNMVIQPYQKGEIVALYNGEIYNYKDFGDYECDGQCLIPLYEKYGSDFVKKLDGEFAICLIDYNLKKIILSTDIFKTKPLFLGFSKNDFACCTYKTPLEKLNFKEIKKAKPNTIYVIDYISKKIISEETLHNFDLNQYKTNYFDWIQAFKNSILKRTRNTDKKFFIGLSSGYDSGLIYKELLAANINFTSFSLIGTENESIIDERINLKNKNIECIKIQKNNSEALLSRMTIKNRTEPFEYTIKSDDGNYKEFKPLIADEGSVNFATICRKATAKNCKICLSGTGCDEIISDYGFNGEKKFPHSNFGGLFPEDLNTIFPWGSFFNSTMESYLAKEEYVGGSFGIEMRYPFLDKNVVQEFLWLDSSLKNHSYKAPLSFCFKNDLFPFEESIKRGF